MAATHIKRTLNFPSVYLSWERYFTVLHDCARKIKILIYVQCFKVQWNLYSTNLFITKSSVDTNDIPFKMHRTEPR